MDRKIGEEVRRLGSRLVRYTKWLLWLIPAAVGLFLLCCIGIAVFGIHALPEYLRLSGPIGMVNFLLCGSYLALGLGLCDLLLYFAGMHFLCLGQLVLNTGCDPEVILPDKEEVPAEEQPPAEEAPMEEPAPQPEEAEEAETAEEEEEDWNALLARDDAVVPAVKTPEQLVAELPPPGKSGRLVSPALMNILRYSLGQEDDGQLAKNLKHGMSRLTKAHEKALLGHILYTPDGDVRAAAAALYKALNEKKA